MGMPRLRWLKNPSTRSEPAVLQLALPSNRAQRGLDTRSSALEDQWDKVPAAVTRMEPAVHEFDHPSGLLGLQSFRGR
ncbi:hypothetical protein NDU88_006143 [Pleurodeles waltl]|uniref:Uncharacterized protein n=1 Tax=Pleurodeles waltl TaxID=8319 RepID=A0AAV7VPY9_PLEWA|nr:hypothetical protein NDU88_006143 [Pleurodeles waltl]